MPVTLEYLGGLFDGEGSVSLIRDGKHYFYPNLMLSNTHASVMAEIPRLLGGNVNRGQGRNFAVHEWQVSCKAGYTAAKLLIPVTVIKREELVAVVKFCDEARPLGERLKRAALRRDPVAENLKRQMIDLGNACKAQIAEIRVACRQPIGEVSRVTA